MMIFQFKEAQIFAAEHYEIDFWYCFGNYVYLFLFYFSFLVNLLFNADFKNAICFWRSHLVFEL